MKCIGSVFCVCLAVAAKAQLTGYEALTNWNDLPKPKTHVTAGLASSYDRLGANNDFNYYLQPTGIQTSNCKTVIAQLAGPGILTRFWMPHATANLGFTVRFIIDEAIALDTTSNILLGGTYQYMNAPLVATLLGGQVCYEPIAFRQSLKIESNNIAPPYNNHYYQYNYHLLAPDTDINPYSPTLSPSHLAARNAAINIITHAGENPAGVSITAILAQLTNQTIAPHSTLILLAQNQGGIVRSLCIKPAADTTDAMLESLRLHVRYDGDASYAIDVPVAHFFGAGFGRVLYKSVPIGTDSPNGYYCFWPMPYENAVEVSLYNSDAQTTAAIISTTVEYEQCAVSCDMGYLHAVYKKQAIAEPYHILMETAGTGHYIGNILTIERTGDSSWILEADDVVVVNPGTSTEETLNGTGLEDAYNAGYYYNHVAEQTTNGDIADPTSGIEPFSGLLHIDFSDIPGYTQTRTDQYRWLILDYVPFTNGICVKTENMYQQYNTIYGSTVFYYLLHRSGTFTDFAAFAAQWLEPDCAGPDWCAGFDNDRNNILDWRDLSKFTGNWLNCN